MIFAAGLGTRMRPFTDTTPKPLARVSGKALIDYALDDFARAGVATAVVNVHHLADQIEAHLAGREAPRIVISDERGLLLDQGGGIKKVLPEFAGRPFFICNTDAFWCEGGAENLRALASRWDSEQMDVALLLAPTRGSVGVDWDGDFELDSDGRIFQPEGPRRYVYSGVGIMKPELFEGVAEDVFKLAPFFFEAAKRGRLYGVPAQGLWLHVGTVAAIAEAERAMAA
ncbi:nucleotidyltransferase family protein [Methylocystis heyeri]|uniref:NTP transferase domain-containing protein n=1 Tax=Methylocystis heyeri TaxID=391905 RepID=A0A6B8KHH0_9HYPH|nr:nucleotidyltransferase family protein [Methylocystis heyeri]QGM45953.1 NTP transferase domain-containing protein [Methylocystis heyeri]